MNEPRRVFSRETLKNKDILTISRSVSRDEFVIWLKNNFRALRCYHTTRTADVSTYYKNGFLPTDMVKAVAYFKQLVKEIGFENDYDLQETIDLFNGHSNRYIYFCLDKEGFLDYSPHYLIYGSELILCFAQRVSPSIKYELKKIGLPTLFHCDIPLDKFDDDELITLYDRVCSATGSHNEKVSEIFSQYGIIVEGHVPGDCIVHHEHPTETLWDAHSGVYYKNDISTCPHCSK
jgi:hypothetical protein